MYDPPGLPPPGWYPDPERPGASRWWDGWAWATSTWSATVDTDALPHTGEMLSNAFRRAVRRWRALAVLGAVAGALPSVLFLLALRRTLDGVAFIDDEWVGWSNDRIPVVIALVVVAMLVSWIGALAVAWLMLQTVDEEQAARGGPLPALTTAGEIDAALTACIRAGSIAPRALLWSLVAMLVWIAALALLVACFVIEVALGVLMLLAYIPLGIWIFAKLAFVLQAIVDGPGNPFARSWGVSRDRFWPVFGRVLLVGLVASVINYGANTATSLANSAETGFGTTTFEIDEDGTSEDVRFDELIPLGPLALAAAGLGAIISTMFATSTVWLAFSEMYRTRNPARR